MAHRTGSSGDCSRRAISRCRLCPQQLRLPARSASCPTKHRSWRPPAYARGPFEPRYFVEKAKLQSTKSWEELYTVIKQSISRLEPRTKKSAAESSSSFPPFHRSPVSDETKESKACLWRDYFGRHTLCRHWHLHQESPRSPQHDPCRFHIRNQ